MKKQIILSFLMGLFVMPLFASEQEVTSVPATQTLTQQRSTFKNRRKEINNLLREYKKSSAEKQQAIKARLEDLVSQGVDDSLVYMKQRLAEERTRLDNWEKKIKADEANLAEVKAQRVEDLLTGAAKKKHRQAKKAWKKQLREQRKNLHK